MCVVPVFGLGLPLHIVLALLVLSCPSCIVSFFFCLVCDGMMQCEMGRAVRVMSGGV